jgi:putative membrane protein
MEWNIVGINFLYAVLGVILMFLSYKIFDKLSPKINFEEELKKGNIAVSIFIAALFIAIALIIAGSLN